MLSIAVCIKQVPDTQKARFDPKTGTIDRNGTESIMNPDDLHAIEMALSIRDRYGAAITAVTMGPPHAADVLDEAYALGVDSCVLVSDPGFAGSDSLVTSKTLSRAITEARERSTSSSPGARPSTATPAMSGSSCPSTWACRSSAQIHKFDVADGHAVIERLYGHEYQKIRVEFPLLLAIGKNSNRVRIPAARRHQCLLR